jgi:hypothetical protein
MATPRSTIDRSVTAHGGCLKGHWVVPNKTVDGREFVFVAAQFHLPRLAFDDCVRLALVVNDPAARNGRTQCLLALGDAATSDTVLARELRRRSDVAMNLVAIMRE